MISTLLRLKIFSLLLLLSISFGQVKAQSCEQIGLVSNGFLLGQFDCEILIIAADGINVFQPATSPEALKPGSFVRFSYEVIDSQACSANIPLINITCLESIAAIEECTAEFISLPNNPILNRNYTFKPLFVDTTKNYLWDFGNGEQTVTPTAEHLYEANGEYLVCLTVSEENGCSQTSCDTIIIEILTEHNCNFSIESMPAIDAAGKEVFDLEVFNQTDFGPYHPQKVKWYEHETGIILGEAANIRFSPTKEDVSVITVCADLEVIFPDGDTCRTTTCQPIVKASAGNCTALFGYIPQISLAATNSVDFFNFSFGDSTANVLWDFGDGQTSTENTQKLRHQYDAPGLYNVCLSINGGIDSCASTFCLPVFTVGAAEICNFNDCVLPGDANKDGNINIFDALNIGIGFNSKGKLRPNAVIEPILQAAFNWQLNTLIGLDFKHFDCDGNGQIEKADFSVIDQNYQKVAEAMIANAEITAPEISLQFAADTLYFNPKQNNIRIPASLIIGGNDVPIEHFYGIALTFDYQDESLITAIETKYDSTSFLGKDDILLYDKNLKEDKQYGLSITKSNQQGKSGAGKIAELSFIVEGDIIDGRSAIFGLDLSGLTVVDSNGIEIPVNVPDEEIEVVLVFDEELTTSIPVLEENIYKIYPNPAKDRLNIDFSEAFPVNNGKIELFNALGQKLQTYPLHEQHSVLDIKHIPAGTYWIHITTKNGVLSKEFIIEK
jgi:PKD repeat protein